MEPRAAFGVRRIPAAPCTFLQSRRDCDLQPRAASPRATLGMTGEVISTPKGLWPVRAAPSFRLAAILSGLWTPWPGLPRVARGLATLGWRTQSLWDWKCVSDACIPALSAASSLAGRKAPEYGALQTLRAVR